MKSYNSRSGLLKQVVEVMIVLMIKNSVAVSLHRLQFIYLLPWGQTISVVWVFIVSYAVVEKQDFASTINNIMMKLDLCNLPPWFVCYNLIVLPQMCT